MAPKKTAALEVRIATREDIPAIVELLRQLASFEGELEHFSLTEPILAQTLFGTDVPGAGAMVAIMAGRPVGLALWFPALATFASVRAMELAHLVVAEDARRQGVGRVLMEALARVCVDHGYGQLRWSVLRSNGGAATFYDGFGAALRDDVRRGSLSSAQLDALVRQSGVEHRVGGGRAR